MKDLIPKEILPTMPTRLCLRDVEIGLDSTYNYLTYLHSVSKEESILNVRVINNNEKRAEILRIFKMQREFNQHLRNIVDSKVLQVGRGHQERSNIVIIVRRHSRRIRNIPDLITAVVTVFSQQPSLMYLEDMDFHDQVEIFRSTRLLIASTGAALTNMVFMEPGGVVLIAMPDHIFGLKCIYVNLALASGLHAIVHKQQ